MDETKSGMGWIGVLFIILVIWAVLGGNFGGRWNQGGWDGCGCTRVSNCEVEKQGLINTAQTQFLIGQEGSATRTALHDTQDALMAQANRIYEQELQERIFDLKLENQQLRGNQFVKEQTDGIAKALAECCCGFNRRLDAIECSMLKRPQLYGVASTCSGQIIPSNVVGTMVG